MYLTYEQYQGMGGQLAQSAYERKEHRARGYVDRATHGRLKGEEDAREAVKRLMYELVEMDAARAGTGGRDVTSESNDGISVSYSEKDDYESRRWALIEDYLSEEATAAGVPLLYAGAEA
ncbi:MAG: hypothetical protein Q4D04_05535 [Clostridia bacterium]|nr:hypothetical protein [Clostridia bacterium]